MPTLPGVSALFQDSHGRAQPIWTTLPDDLFYPDTRARVAKSTAPLTSLVQLHGAAAALRRLLRPAVLRLWYHGSCRALHAELRFVRPAGGSGLRGRPPCEGLLRQAAALHDQGPKQPSDFAVTPGTALNPQNFQSR